MKVRCLMTVPTPRVCIFIIQNEFVISVFQQYYAWKTFTKVNQCVVGYVPYSYPWHLKDLKGVIDFLVCFNLFCF